MTKFLVMGAKLVLLLLSAYFIYTATAQAPQIIITDNSVRYSYPNAIR